MKFPPTPILALLALGGACSLEPPSSHSRGGGNAGTTTPDSVGIGGSGGEGGSSSAIAASGGNTAQRDAGVVGGNSANGGASTPTSTGSTFSGGGTPVGGSTSGGTATGGARGGSTVTGGSSMGGTMAGGSTAGGSRTTTGGTTATGGSTASGGTSARGGATGGAATGGTATGGTSTSPGGTHAQPPPITNGSSGFATRYWDCCKPSCGWSANANGKPTHTCDKSGTTTVGNDTQSACSGGSGYMCYWGAPWSVSDTLSYGFAAYNGVDCGTCFQIQFTGKGQYNDKDPGSMALNGKTMIVQVINIGGIAANQFDLLIPGGGVGANNACTGGSAQWSGASIGDTNGGMLTTCKDSGSCVSQMCQSAFGNMPQLLAGCNWVSGWFAAADNPQMVYQKTTCPPDITAKSGM
jgi:Glycosyl hydrolase family 45